LKITNIYISKIFHEIFQNHKMIFVCIKILNTYFTWNRFLHKYWHVQFVPIKFRIKLMKLKDLYERKKWFQVTVKNNKWNICYEVATYRLLDWALWEVWVRKTPSCWCTVWIGCATWNSCSGSMWSVLSMLSGLPRKF
jgi:hypothetical protein